MMDFLNKTAFTLSETQVITWLQIVYALGFLIMAWFLSRLLAFLVVKKLLNAARISQDSRAIIQRILFYTLVVLVLLTLLAYLGIPLATFAFISGAVAIGFGFGLTFLSCTVLILRYFGSGPYLQLFSTLNLFATVAASAPYICGTMRDVTGSFVSPFLLVGAMPAVVFVVVSFMRPPKLVKEAGKTASVSPPTVHNDTQLTAAKEL